MTESIDGNILTEARKARKDVHVHLGKTGGIEYRTAQVPIDYYLKRELISNRDYYVASRLFKDFYLSGQTIKGTGNFDSVRSDDQKAYLPATELQREALDNWRQAMDSINTLGALMLLNVCCYGYWIKDITYMHYKTPQAAMARFREALSDLSEFYRKIDKRD